MRSMFLTSSAIDLEASIVLLYIVSLHCTYFRFRRITTSIDGLVL
jgi:hypothetical protein